MNIDFNIMKNPPSLSQLVEERKDVAATKKIAVEKERGVKRLLAALVLMLVGLLLWVSIGGVRFVSQPFMAALVSAVAMASVTVVVGYVIASAAYAGLAVNSLRDVLAILVVGLCGCFVVVGVVTLIVNESGETVQKWVDLGVIFGMVAGAVLFSAMWPFLEKYRTAQWKTDATLLPFLAEFTAEENPEECIEYDKFRQRNADVEQYHKKIILMSRRPVMAEYRAAKAWVESEGERKKRVEAQKACGRMMTPA